MQMLTTEAAQAEIINKDFTSPETVLPLPSFGRSLQHLQQQGFRWWTMLSHPCLLVGRGGDSEPGNRVHIALTGPEPDGGRSFAAAQRGWDGRRLVPLARRLCRRGHRRHAEAGQPRRRRPRRFPVLCTFEHLVRIFNTNIKLSQQQLE